MTSERDKVREDNAGTPGRGHLIEAALAERENAKAYGNDTAPMDARLADLGYTPDDVRAAQRKEAADKRKAAADDKDGEDSRRSAPAGRTATPRSTTAKGPAKK